MSDADARPANWLICRAATYLCALRLDQVTETMRPLPVARLANAPPFVQGVSIIRGAPVPVIDANLLLGDASGRVGRFVSITLADGRRAALAVGQVLGIRSIPDTEAGALPSVLRDADAGLVDAIGVLDNDLLLFFKTTLLVPDAAWRALDQDRTAS